MRLEVLSPTMLVGEPVSNKITEPSLLAIESGKAIFRYMPSLFWMNSSPRVYQAGKQALGTVPWAATGIDEAGPSHNANRKQIQCFR